MYKPFSEDAERDPSDAHLLEEICQGVRQALEQLIRRHQGWIFNIAVRMVWDPHEAEAQEVLVKVHGPSGISASTNFARSVSDSCQPR